ncbi:MAG: oxidase [Gemmatales bacterium]|nr:MAG: oxidase [Gemmatales bacterium]
MDEQQREHIRDDLKDIIKGEVLFDDISRVLYSTDASIFQVSPIGVVTPRDEEDVQALVRYALENQISLIPRGAGSGLAGESLGAGIIVDLSRHFRAIIDIGTDTVRVQPGVVLRDLNKRLAERGKRFAPDPASGAYCTIGGMIATNASGARSLRYGYTRDHVAKLRVVWDTGETAEAGREPRHSSDLSSGRLWDITTAVAALIEENSELIRQCQPKTRFNRCGYLLHDVLSRDHVDLARLLTGSEGTLAIVTEATLRTIDLPQGRSAVLLSFPDLETALQAARRSLSTGPSACELLDHRLLTLVRQTNAEVERLVPAAAGAVLLVEYEGDSPASAGRDADELVRRLQYADRLALHSVKATDPDDVDRLWQLRSSALPNLYGMRATVHPLPFIEDVAVPLDCLPEFVRQVQDVMQKHDTTASFLVHAGSGQVHTRPFLNLNRPGDVTRLWSMAHEVHDLALRLHGTVSTQHGVGLARTPWIEKQYGPLYAVMKEIKAIFDPYGLFNPGKIIGPHPEMPAWPLRKRLGTSSRLDPRSAADSGVQLDLRPPAGESGVDLGIRSSASESSSVSSRRSVEFGLLHWRPGEAHGEVMRCNGCGECRTEAPQQRMCPIFRATIAEEATPRAKANLLHDLLADNRGANAGHRLSSEEVRRIADLCVNCKMCARECPARVNIPKLMLETKAANIAQYGMSRAQWALARMEAFAALGSRFALIVNQGLSNPLVRWLIEKLFHVSRRRRLPAFARDHFFKRLRRRGQTRKQIDPRKLVYFVDVFANYNDPELAEATVAVLKHNGFDVEVPLEQVGCGMAPLVQGDIDAAREAATVNVKTLSEYAREGCTIICSEPTAALMMREDYPDLLNSTEAALVAEHTVELTEFLWQLYERGELKTHFHPLQLVVGHHVPCHIKALEKGVFGPQLLSLIPGMRVHTIDVGCSGMAGTFGFAAENYDLSRAAGRAMFDELKKTFIQFGSSECSACRLQMEDGTLKRALHPVQYLAIAYGLLPELSRRLEKPIGNLTL